MAQHPIERIVIMVLALLGALVILFVVGSWLMRTVGHPTAGTAGIGAVAVGVSARLLSFLVAAVIVLVLAIMLIRQGRR